MVKHVTGKQGNGDEGDSVKREDQGKIKERSRDWYDQEGEESMVVKWREVWWKGIGVQCLGVLEGMERGWKKYWRVG